LLDPEARGDEVPQGMLELDAPLNRKKSRITKV